MELIANLEHTQTSEGLTPENLAKLERTFRQAVGENHEINLENFKRLIQSKNPFFTERIFRVLDVDQSGTISLEEFMHVMRCFALNTPEIKLRYLFDVYDINGDGLIQFVELREVLGECLKENGLKFGEEELNELSEMLFEDADADQNGAISFQEFKNQIAKQPGLIENIALSIEQWLIPPADRPRKLFPYFNFQCLKKVTWKHIRNNWTNALFLVAFFVANLSFFFMRVYDYCDHNVYVIVARACGQCLNFNCAFVVLFVLRQTLTWLRTNGFSQYLPIDHHIYYHQLTGILILLYSLVHAFAHVLNFATVSEEKGVSFMELLTSTRLGIGWVGGAACLTGWISLFILLVMCITAMPFVRQTGKFEIFYCLHLLSLIFWTCLIIHAPNFWKWFLGPAILYFFEQIIRFCRNFTISKLAYVQQGVLLPSKVTHLVIKRPPKFDYKPGDYVYINIPAIARFEWHPFTISSAPELDDVIWLHIRGVGEWTNSLYEYFQKEDQKAVLSDELARKPLEALPEHIRYRTKNPIFSTPTDSTDFSALNATFVRSGPGIEALFRTKGSVGSAFRNALDDNFTNSSFNSPDLSDDGSHQRTVIEMEPPCQDRTFSISTNGSLTTKEWKNRTSFTSLSMSARKKNREDIRSMLARHSSAGSSTQVETSGWTKKRKRRCSVRVSVAQKGLKHCQTVIIMPTVDEEDEDESRETDTVVGKCLEEKIVDVVKEQGSEENVIVRQTPLKIFIDGPYGSPTRHLFQSRHAVLIAAGIGVTPFASILQSIVSQYRKSRHVCPNCQHNWTDAPVFSNRLKKVDFFWLNRHQRAFEWFVNILSELEAEQAQEKERFLDIHMYITSALRRTDMKAVGLQMALDLLYQRERRDLITGLKSRTQPGRPDWDKVFSSLAQQKKGKVTVFFCGPNQLARILQGKCDEFGFHFRKEIF